jgi:glyceraldehyde 3-phosphate dehydrogenase
MVANSNNNMRIRVAINGFGRIGRECFKVLSEKNNIDVVAINDLTDSKTLAHLLKYDSVHGIFNKNIMHDENTLFVNGKATTVYAQKDAVLLPWKNLNVDIVVDATGKHLSKELAGKHLVAGAKKVIISAPPTDNDIKAVVLGVNDSIITMDDRIISNASCTTNCAAPMIKVLDELWGVEDGFITTVHSYTGDQRLHDAPHKDLRRARAAALSIVPTSTGAAKAITKIFPHLNGKLGGCGMRVPVPNGSLTDITCVLNKPVDANQINAAFKQASEQELKGILQYMTDPIVSIDIINNVHSCVFDPEFTSVVGNLVKIIGWYDNESGYSNRLADLIEKISG